MSKLFGDSWPWFFLFFFFFFFFLFCFFGCTRDIWKFPGQGLNPRCSCISDVGSLTHCTRLGTQPPPPQRQHQIFNLLGHSGKSQGGLFVLHCSYIPPLKRKKCVNFGLKIFMLSSIGFWLYSLLKLQHNIFMENELIIKNYCNVNTPMSHFSRSGIEHDQQPRSSLLNLS